MGEFHDRRFDVGSMVLSGIECVPVTAARGVVIALHGSGYTSRYWDCPHETASSLLRMGADLGFRVVAIDRPGYGAAHDIPGEKTGLDAQAVVLGALIASVHAESAQLPVFLIGHSLGSLLAVRLAASEAAAHVAGVDVMGLPVQWRSDVRSHVELVLNGVAPLFPSEQMRLAMHFGPAGTFDPRVLELERSFSHRIPRKEMEQSLHSARMLREYAPRVRVPVQHTVAEFEGCIASGEEMLARGRSLFSSSRRVAVYLQANAGHNVSLHKVGRAYHLRALTFFEEIIASAELDGMPVAAIVGEAELTP
jgi:pimeloyl-ACP methyl ester carboxylesterase